MRYRYVLGVKWSHRMSEEDPDIRASAGLGYLQCAAGIPYERAAFMYASASIIAASLSKSAITHQQVSSSLSGYRPMCASPRRWASMTTGVIGR